MRIDTTTPTEPTKDASDFGYAAHRASVPRDHTKDTAFILWMARKNMTPSGDIQADAAAMLTGPIKFDWYAGWDNAQTDAQDWPDEGETPPDEPVE